MAQANNTKYLVQLARKVLEGKASVEEKLFLDEYYNAFEKHGDVSAEMTDEEKLALQQAIRRNISAAIEVRDKTIALKPYRFLRVAAAAITLVLLSAGAYYIFFNKPPHQNLSRVPVKNDVVPGGNKARLTLANGSTILLDDIDNGELAKQGNIVIEKTDEGRLVYTVGDAAPASPTVGYNTVATPRGGQYQVVLPDGSRVWLNASSSIRFPTSFSGNQRNVEMTGEAYFEVARNKAAPFLVKTNKATVKVLGTHFNILAYDDEDALKATLLEGSVEISGLNGSVIIKPGEQARVAKEKISVTSDIDVEEVVAWKNGLFNFKDAGIEAIMRQASRWYDVKVKFEGEVPLHQFNGKIDRNVNLSQLMEMLNYSGVEFIIKGDTIIIKE